MKRESHESAGVVLFREGTERSYLLLRSALTRRPLWEFPKGGIEAGETEIEAAARELGEETGLAVGDYRMLDGFRAEEHYFFTHGKGESKRLIRKRVVYFLARWRSGDVRLSPEATRFVWAAVDDANRLLKFSEKRRVLEAAERWLSGDTAGGPRIAVPRG